MRKIKQSSYNYGCIFGTRETHRNTHTHTHRKRVIRDNGKEKKKERERKCVCERIKLIRFDLNE